MSENIHFQAEKERVYESRPKNIQHAINILGEVGLIGNSVNCDKYLHSSSILKFHYKQLVVWLMDMKPNKYNTLILTVLSFYI